MSEDIRARTRQPAEPGSAGMACPQKRDGGALFCFPKFVVACEVVYSPGFVNCSLSFPPGFARNTFATITSLLPGSVPADEADGSLVYHCLDDTTPVVEQLWQEERLLAKALVAGQRHG